jgi:hypothetical protein
MQGLSLIHAGFLAAGLMAIMPVVIHLLFRQRTRTVPIGSIRFLHHVVREHRRRRRIRQWLLLALRILVVLLLALLFARPYWNLSHLLGLDQEVVLLLDRSASMQARDTRGETSDQRALKVVQSEVSGLDENVILHTAAFDAAGVAQMSFEHLMQVTPSEAATDFGLALSWARDLLQASVRRQRRIVLVTDLQQSGLSPTVLEPLPEGVELIIRDVGNPMLRNVSVDLAEAARTEIRPDREVLVRAVLRNHGPLPARNLTATCEVESESGSRHRATRLADIPGRGYAVVEFPLAIRAEGLHAGRVTIDIEDALELDNTRWLAWESRRPDRVLLVDGQAGRTVFLNETYYLETALRLRTEESRGQYRSFDVERMVWEAGEGFPNLDGFRAIVLANVRRLSREDARRLEAYVRDGGSLLVCAGDQVTRESLAPLEENGIFPGRLGNAPVSGSFRIDHWEQTHPAFLTFRDPQQGDLRRVTLHTALPLVSVAPDGVALLRSGEWILAAERRAGKGRCLYFGGTADRDWTELPRTPMYVPLMRQMLAYLTDQLAGRAAVTYRLVQRPDERAGIVRAAQDDKGGWVVTNLDPRESALERISSEQLEKLAGSVSMESGATDTMALSELLPPDSLRPDEIWPSVVWLLFALLAAETLLAGRVHA